MWGPILLTSIEVGVRGPGHLPLMSMESYCQLVEGVQMCEHMHAHVKEGVIERVYCPLLFFTACIEHKGTSTNSKKQGSPFSLSGRALWCPY